MAAVRKINHDMTKRLNARIKMFQIAVVPGWKIYVTDTVRGRCCYTSKTITVPVWAMKEPREGYWHWYLCHEIAHSIAGYIKGRPHGREFMEALKMVCPAEYWHYETEYKPRNAQAAGIRKPKQ